MPSIVAESLKFPSANGLVISRNISEMQKPKSTKSLSVFSEIRYIKNLFILNMPKCNNIFDMTKKGKIGENIFQSDHDIV